MNIQFKDGQYEATQNSPKSDGVLQVGTIAWGDTHSEAINKCLAKVFGVSTLTEDEAMELEHDKEADKFEAGEEQFLESIEDDFGSAGNYN